MYFNSLFLPVWQELRPLSAAGSPPGLGLKSALTTATAWYLHGLGLSSLALNWTGTLSRSRLLVSCVARYMSSGSADMASANPSSRRRAQSTRSRADRHCIPESGLKAVSFSHCSKITSGTQSRTEKNNKLLVYIESTILLRIIFANFYVKRILKA